MNPKTLSASSLQVALGCLSRFKYEYIDYARGEAGDAARVGLVCHLTLERLFREVFIKKTKAWCLDALMFFFEEAYHDICGADKNSFEYGESRDILVRWFNDPLRAAQIGTFDVLSLEAKNTFDLPVVVNGKTVKVPVTYIMDRVDRLADGEYRVVDYKSQRIPWTATELHEKLQARLYALALQIIHKDAKRIWVQFDFLRDEPVEIALTRADQVETWNMLRRAAQRIFDTSDEVAAKTETINSECVYCIRKPSCGALQKTIAAGGIHSLPLIDAGRLLDEVKSRAKALKSLEDELQDYLLAGLIKEQAIDLTLDDPDRGDSVNLKLKRDVRRSVDSSAVAALLGPELTAELGSFTLGSLDALLKSRRLGREQATQLRALMVPKKGEPKVAVTVQKRF